MGDAIRQYDALVIGSGHNGLIAAGYLAKAGKRVLVLERRDIIGGATVTEEPFPGYRLSTCSYVCNLLLPEVIRDFDLVRHGYHIRPFDPTYFAPFPDGRYFAAYLDGAKTREQIARFSKKDVRAYGAYWEMWDRIIARMQPLIRRGAPSEEEIAVAFDGEAGAEDWHTLTKASIAEVLDRFFESDEIKAPLSTGGVIGVNAGPYDPGTAYVKFHHLIGTVGGYQGAWGFVRGGMGTVASALAAACVEAGVRIETASPVAEIDVTNGRATGVRLEDGRRFFADVVVSNADPQHTFLQLVGAGHLPAEYTDGIRAIRSKGAVVKVLLALAELPNFTAMPGTSVGPQHTGGIVINPSVDYLDAAWRECAEGRPSRRPFMDCYIQTATEDGLAPAGKHTMSMFVQYAPYDLVDGTWDERPVACYPSYATPVAGLYLCGAGAWPGGAVFGAPGRNCAQQVLADLAP